MTPGHARASRPGGRAAFSRNGAFAAAALLAAGTACASITYSAVAGGGPRSITLQVGSNNATINSVTFDVLGNDIAPTPVPITGVAGGGAPGTSPAGGIAIIITTNRRGAGTDVVRLTADSSSGLTCQSGTCLGSGVTIPFNTISWTSYEPTGLAFSAGIGTGSFNGSATQSLFTHTIPGAVNNSLVVSNVLIFSYDNSTLYPSGVYSGRVTYTASVP